MAVAGSILGNTVLRREDPELLEGAAKYVDDITPVGTLAVVFVRSNVAHGQLLSVDISAAEKMPGVHAVYTAKNTDLPDYQAVGFFNPLMNRPIFAKDKVRFVGDIVAAIVADSRGAGVDAAETVVVDIKALPSVTDPELALAEGAPLLFEEAGTNIVMPAGLGDENPLEDAEVIVKARVVSQRLAGVPMEVNGILVVPENGRLVCWTSTQAPHSVKEVLAGMIGVDPEVLHVKCPSVGGGFGPKAAVYVEFGVAAYAAQKLNKPVRWFETRSENMLSLVHGRGMVLNVEMGFTKGGIITGMKADVTGDAGAYPMIGAMLILGTQTMAHGTYRIPKLNFQARSVVTNTTSTGAYRGAGRPEATQMLERVMDLAADDLGIDPAELRRRNLLKSADFPLTTSTGANYDCGEYEKALDMVLEKSDYKGLLVEQARRRAAGDTKLLGIGLSTYVEITAPFGLHVEWGGVEVEADGTIVAKAGTSGHGQGHDTMMAMIVSDQLGVPMDQVKYIQSDTDLVPKGSGTMGSRSLQVGGSAVHVSAGVILEKAKLIAAHLLEASADDIVKGEGTLHVAGVPSRSLTWADLAAAANDPAKLPEGMEPGLSHSHDFDGQSATFPFGAHVAVVEVDSDTGKVELMRHIAVDDCGKILSPMMVKGQQHGGIAQGAAQALFEWVQYDEDGNPVTGTLVDYSIPSAAELPSFETYNTETPTFRNPMGAKGIGESGTIGSTPAIQNAVIDAVSHLGVRHIDMPTTPQRVWDAINAAAAVKQN
jgi:aerobic carbon-monoxide dehydrogenase large subunit